MKKLCKQPPIDKCGENIMHFLRHKKLSSAECLRPLTSGNYLTHSNQEVHFTIANPMPINISCLDNTVSFLLNQSSSIVDASNCTISSNNLKYKVNNTLKYELIKIFNINKNENHNEKIRMLINVTLVSVISLSILFTLYTIYQEITYGCCEGNIEVNIETTPNGILNTEALKIKEKITPEYQVIVV